MSETFPKRVNMDEALVVTLIRHAGFDYTECFRLFIIGATGELKNCNKIIQTLPCNDPEYAQYEKRIALYQNFLETPFIP